MKFVRANGLTMARYRQSPPDYICCRHCHRDFRAITVSHLRSTHGYTSDHPIQDYKRRFRLSSATCREVRTRIREKQEAFWAKKGQRRTRPMILAEIRRLHRAGRHLRQRDVANWLYLSASRTFGTWRAAVQAAGLNYDKVSGIEHWSRERVIAEIQALAKRHVLLNATYVQQHFPTLHNVAVKRFPRSWAKALFAAGLNPYEHKMPRGRWDNTKAAKWVRKHARRGRSVLAQRAPVSLVSYVQSRTKGGWAAFVESLGLVYPGIKRRRDWTADKLVAEMRKRKRAGLPMYYKAVQRTYQALIFQAKKFFGSWDAARRAAGV